MHPSDGELSERRNGLVDSSGAALKGFSTWGAYGASKAAMNHLAMTLASEEPDVTTIAIRPGIVDTHMQSQIADVHSSKMSPEDGQRFAKMRAEGTMLRPDQPGNVMARLVLSAPKDLSGRFIEYT